jgi:hypothetical protein
MGKLKFITPFTWNLCSGSILSIAAFLLAACGDDYNTVQQPGYLINANAANGNAIYTPLVAGQYFVQLSPLASSCINFQPLPTNADFGVSQFGDVIFVATNDSINSSFTLNANVPPLQGPLYNNGSFNAGSTGVYIDPFSGFNNTIQVTMSGAFDQFGISGVRDTVLFDPGIGGNCLISHSFIGDRQ